ncbi:hypothetical protein BFJ63_vAg15428 [Fusarium oxysporum f. sp. narcissi]|uniref:non-specific serine/threonine protein kinase n=1 Tax=Fusarium oxysporum f. sp. narcissi TaxID=451672 RepID=A0A4V1RYI0_FUSOX|nr:hypothetical protein BFJ63_vAg15428 [Fusarium oxysporum f. sp. narcissi]
MSSSTDSLDLANVVLFLGSFNGIDDIVSLSDNKRYHIIPPAASARWEGNESLKGLTGPILCLTFGKHLFSPEGWVLGSSPDPDLCDLQLSKDNSTGISRRHLRVDTDPITLLPRLTVISTSGAARLLEDGRALTLTRGKSVEILRMVTIDLGAVSFRVWRPNLTEAEQRRYKIRALDWCKEAVAAVATYVPPLHSPPETLTSNIRYGRNNAVYVNEGGVEGRGMTASVMCVKERTSGLVYGAKEPYFKVSDDFGKVRSRWEELKKEFDNVVALDHPHIVRAIELVMAEDKKLPPWLIMEYIPQSLEPKGLDQQETITVLTQISSALAYMHAQGITHRDVKPDNILIKDLGIKQAKLADFGTAKRITHSRMDTFIGSPIYMAPEFLDRPLSYNNKVDLFSLGLIGLQCLTSWDPQTDQNWTSGPLSCHDYQTWMRNVVVQEIANAPSAFQPWLRSMLRRMPQKRGSAPNSLILLWQAQHGGGPAVPENIEASAIHQDTHSQQDLTRTASQQRNKRPASFLSESSSRHQRREQPRPTTPSHAAHFQDTSESPQARTSSFAVPSSPYSAPTPHDIQAALEESDEWEPETDKDLEHDWE